MVLSRLLIMLILGWNFGEVIGVISLLGLSGMNFLGDVIGGR